MIKNVVIIFSMLTTAVSCTENNNTSKQSIKTKITKESVGESLAENNDQNQELSSTSLFNLPGQWVSQSWDTLELDDLRGKVLVLAMIYTHCNYSCPRLIADMVRIESDIPMENRKKVSFVLVSIDPANDPPDTLASFAKEHKMKRDQWTLLTGREDNVQDLAAVLGFKYKRTSPIDFAHSRPWPRHS